MKYLYIHNPFNYYPTLYNKVKSEWEYLYCRMHCWITSQHNICTSIIKSRWRSQGIIHLYFQTHLSRFLLFD